MPAPIPGNTHLAWRLFTAGSNGPGHGRPQRGLAAPAIWSHGQLGDPS
jgi:hypothetical protein